jgi:uncharacterized protein (TIGR02996 family)
MTDRDAMLRAIAANPDDDTPRLIYADLLDELGGDANTARARFIRLQIETHRHTYNTFDARLAYDLIAPSEEDDTAMLEQKRAEAVQLANRYQSQWLRELPTWCNPVFGLVGMTRANLFVRGFVERVSARAKPFAFRTEELFDTNPIRALELQGGSTKLLPAVFSRAELARVRSLDFSWGGVPAELVAAISECPHLTALTHLDLSKCSLSGSDVRVLAQSVQLSALRKICLGGSLTASAVRLLAASAKLGNLREIDLQACRWSFDVYGVYDLREEFPNITFLAWD